MNGSNLINLMYKEMPPESITIENDKLNPFKEWFENHIKYPLYENKLYYRF